MYLKIFGKLFDADLGGASANKILGLDNCSPESESLGRSGFLV